MKFKTFNILKWVLFIIFFPWCILQNIVGFGVFIYSLFRGHCKRIKTDEGFIYFETDNKSPCYGVSLGYWVFLNETHRYDTLSHHHEFGHQIQSLIYGPLYLIVIGIPSGLSNVWNTYKGDTCIYFNYPWERNADFFGGVLHKDLKYTRELKKMI